MREIDGHAVSSWSVGDSDRKADLWVKIKAGKVTQLHGIEQVLADQLQHLPRMADTLASFY
jgi:hypothetical protein